MKKFLKVVLIIFLMLMSIGALLVGKGYSMYKQALEDEPLIDKIQQIMERRKLY